ncbi:MAG TPA: peroxiredoxin [Gammaproteobacteria bacterium]|nr:peroxiredoxin [Gammaproteobacteria bacterium]
MTIKVGDKVPEGGFAVMGSDGPGGVTSAELFEGKKVVLFSVPGAFTPACSATHLPGYVANSDAIKAKGIDTVACLAVNDVFVMDAWGSSAGADGKVTMLADGNGDYTKALGLELDASGFGMGTRGLRFALIVNNGEVSHLFVEESPSEVKASSAENVLSNL